jgi:hypothetical protein
LSEIPNQIVRDENTTTDALAIVEKYEAFVSYLYPILQNAPHRHGVLRNTVLAALFVPIGGLYHAAKSKQVSRLYAVDAEFATLRSYLRFLAQGHIRILTPRQHVAALALLSESGKMLGSWLRKLRTHSNSAPTPHVDDASASRRAAGAGVLQASGLQKGQAGK